ncbi:hypothetical protein BC629DRAFT_1198405 [Irpex lacteus]|nr:hypothetical protein BC629DRAFT_1198405 [Irpex lacteus]
MRRILLVHVLLTVSWVSAHPAVVSYPSNRKIAPRQAALPATTSSYDYWWPYPAWSASTSTAPLTSPIGATSPLVAAATTTPAISPSLPATNQVVNLPSLDPASASSTLPASSSTTSITLQSSSTPSSTSSAPRITITALPPGINPTRHYKQTGFRSFHPGYLAGIFAVVGAIVGFVFSWILLAIIRKCTSSRRSKPFVAGAPYSAPPEQAPQAQDMSMNRQLTDIHVAVSRFLGVPPPESRPMLEGGGDASVGVGRQRSWLQRAFTGHKREAARSRADSAVQDAASARELLANQEDTPFLAPPPRGHTPSRAQSSRSGRDVHRDRSLAVRNVQSPQELEDNEELDNAPFDTLRHKSIRRDILSRIQHGSRYRKGHKRVDSDVNVDEMRHSEGGVSVLTTAFRESPPAEHPTSTSRPVPVSSAQSSGPGFRIVEEDSEFESAYSHTPSRPSRSNTPAKIQPTDSYTALPARIWTPEKRNAAKAADPTTKTPRAHISRVDSAVLPASPPRVTSPPLEAQLFFGSTPAFGPAPKLEFSVSSEGYQPQIRTASPSKKVTAERKKLRTQRDPPHLPFPSSPQFSPTKHLHLTKKTPRPPSLTHSAETQASSSSASKSSSSSTPAERFARRHGALSKVEQILAASWSARELRGEECPASPNMFGAIPEEHHHGARGIEQRLLG